MPSSSFSARLFLLAFVVALIGAFLSIEELNLTALLMVIVFLVLEFRNAPRLQQIVGTSLAIMGLAAGAYSGTAIQVFVDGGVRTLPFLILFTAVSWLQRPATDSPSLMAMREMVINQPSGRRFIILALAIHALGSALNLAGLSLLSSMVERQKDSLTRKRLSVALMMGFTSASCWSPFYVGIVVVLIAIPQLRWVDVALPGFAFALGIMACGWAYDSFIVRGKEAAPSANIVSPSTLPLSTIWNVCAILISLVFLVLAMVELVGLSIPVTLGLIGPPYALIWNKLISGPDQPHPHKQLTSRVVSSFPGLRSETLVFGGANIFGVGLSSLFSYEAIASAVNSLALIPSMLISLIVLVIIASGALGLHPVIVVIVIGEIFTPEILGVTPTFLGFALVGSWGLSTLVSPMSATTLYMSRVTGEASHVIAWRWNFPIVILATMLMGAILLISYQFGIGKMT